MHSKSQPWQQDFLITSQCFLFHVQVKLFNSKLSIRLRVMIGLNTYIQYSSVVLLIIILIRSPSLSKTVPLGVSYSPTVETYLRFAVSIQIPCLIYVDDTGPRLMMMNQGSRHWHTHAFDFRNWMYIQNVSQFGGKGWKSKVWTSQPLFPNWDSQSSCSGI